MLEHLHLVGDDGVCDEGLGLGFLQAERVALPCLVALVIVDSDLKSLRQAVVGRIVGLEVEAAGRAADSTGRGGRLESVLVVEVLVLTGGSGDNDLWSQEIGERGAFVLSEAPGVVGKRRVETRGGCGRHWNYELRMMKDCPGGYAGLEIWTGV